MGRDGSSPLPRSACPLRIAAPRAVAAAAAWLTTRMEAVGEMVGGRDAAVGAHDIGREVEVDRGGEVHSVHQSGRWNRSVNMMSPGPSSAGST